MIKSLKVLFVLFVLYGLLGCNSESPDYLLPDSKVSGLTISTSKKDVNPGENVKLGAFLMIDGLNNKDITENVDWHIKNKDQHTSLIRGDFLSNVKLSQGEVKTYHVYATYLYLGETLTSNVVDIKVSPINLKLKINADKESVYSGGAVTLNAILQSGNQDIRTNVSSSVLWVIEKKDEFTSISNGKFQTTVDISSGSDRKYTVYAEYHYGGMKVKSNKLIITVTPAILTRLEINPKLIVRNIKEELNPYTVFGYFSNLKKTRLVDGVEWKSSDESIAQISSDGRITTVTPGSSVITATYREGKSILEAKSELIVVEGSVTRIKLTCDSLSISVGVSKRCKVTGYLSDSSAINLTAISTLTVDKPSVLALSSNKIIGVTANKAAVLSAKYKGYVDTATINVLPAKLDKLLIKPSTQNVPLASDVYYTLEATFSDGTVKDVTSDASYKVKINPSLRVVRPGVLRSGNKASIGVISIAKDGVMSNQAVVNVLPIYLSKLKISPSDSNSYVSLPVNFKVVAEYSDGSNVDVTKHSSFESLNKLGTILSKPKGKYMPEKVGLEKIKASFNGKVVETNLNIKSGYLDFLEISSPLTRLIQGLTAQVSATGVFSDGARVDITNVVEWNSSNRHIVSVSNIGVAKATAQGQSIITAKYNGKTSNSVIINVTEAKVVSLKLTPSSMVLPMGYNLNLKVIAKLTDGSFIDASDSVRYSIDEMTPWHDSNPTVITLSGKSTLAVMRGSAVVSAKIGELKSNSITLTVVDAALLYVRLVPNKTKVYQSNKQTNTVDFEIFAKYSDSSAERRIQKSAVSFHVATTSPGYFNFSTSLYQASSSNLGLNKIKVTYKGISSSPVTIETVKNDVKNIDIINPISELKVNHYHDYQVRATHMDGFIHLLSNTESGLNFTATGRAIINAQAAGTSSAVAGRLTARVNRNTSATVSVSYQGKSDIDNFTIIEGPMLYGGHFYKFHTTWHHREGLDHVCRGKTDYGVVWQGIGAPHSDTLINLTMNNDEFKWLKPYQIWASGYCTVAKTRYVHNGDYWCDWDSRYRQFMCVGAVKPLMN
ncbi:hypothetical protein AB6E21_05130 [Photobacterium swingsii]|uniref:hypothetical protein n=1 Tax=Photobacterium swingsii TaxID=680026 RepID=UPI00354D8337